MKKKRKYGFMDYLRDEIGIEYKSTLYFFALVFFYACHRLYRGVYTAELLHLGEMIMTTYIMNYIALFLLRNFDEAEHFRFRELMYAVLCSAVYTVTAHLCGWFDRVISVELIFFGFWVFAYYCAYLVNKIRRGADTLLLNEELDRFKDGRDKDEKRN